MPSFQSAYVFPPIVAVRGVYRPDHSVAFGSRREEQLLRSASRHNPDGTVSFVTVAPGIVGFEFVVDPGPEPTLIVRDAQHEYVFAADTKSSSSN
jgi:hypothetical protein